MKRRMCCLLLCTVLLVAAAVTGALAEKQVVIEELKYGADAFALHTADQINTFVCDGVTYQLEDKWFDFAPAVELWGGKTRAVYEHTVPQSILAASADQPCVLGTISITPTVKATLVIGAGDRLTGEFTLSDPIELTAPYSEQVTLPRNEQGDPVLIDKIYMYSFEEGGVQQHFAAAFYVDYETAAASVGGEQPAAEPTATEPATETGNKQTSPLAFAIPVIVLAAVGCLFMKRKKPQTTEAPDEPAAEAPADDLGELKALAGQVQDEATREMLNKFVDLCEQIRGAVEKKPEKASQTRKFFGYYVPTAKRLVGHLVTTEQRTTQPDQMEQALNTVRYGMQMACTAAEKQLDNMYRHEQMDADADIAVMENMLKVDGFADTAAPVIIPPEKQKNG